MSNLVLTPEMMAAAYEYLRVCRPFKRLKMPPANVVKFIVSRSKRDYAAYQWNGTQHTISLSQNSVSQSLTLFLWMGHEMVHLYLEENGLEPRRGTRNSHSKLFNQLAVRVCREHGWDHKLFV